MLNVSAGTLHLNGVHLDGRAGSNARGNGGAARIGSGATLTLTNSRVTGNRSGGAFYVDGGTLELTRTHVSDNESASGAGGGAVFLRGGTLASRNSRFEANQSTHPLPLFSGGAVHGGAILATAGATVSMESDTLRSNQASYGGALAVQDASCGDINLTDLWAEGKTAALRGGAICTSALRPSP